MATEPRPALDPVGELARAPRPDMPLDEALATRRSVRTYQDREVPEAVVEVLVAQALNAPSACNRRGWKFILVRDPRALRRLHRAGGAAFLPRTRQALVVAYSRLTDNRVWQDDVQSAAAAIFAFQLAAHARGIGSCWVCHLPTKGEVRRMFGIDRRYAPIALVTFGYYPEALRVRRREAASAPGAFLCRERWDFPPEALRRHDAPWWRRAARRLYYAFPWRGLLRGWTGKFEKRFDHEDLEP